MGDIVRALDWSTTPLGPMDSWPQSLRTAVSLCLSSTFPMNIIWGPESIQIYNDGYRVVCGDVHPRALGEDYRVTWASAWPAIGESFGRAWAGERMFTENQRMFLKRLNGRELEETFFTFSHSPIQDESGSVGGLFHPVTETTATMLAERRTRALRDLAASLAAAADEKDVARRTVEILAQFEFDLPFVLYYIFEPQTGRYDLAALHGIARGTPATQSDLDLAAEDKAGWPFAQALVSASIVEVGNLRTTILQGVPCGPYEEPPRQGFVIPVVVPAAQQAPAVIVTAASSRLPLTADYRSFYDLLGVTVAGALGAVRAREDERRRAEALAEIDRAKTAFFSNVSHEFRTPLTLMLGPLEEAMARSQNLAPSEREQLATVHRNALRLLKLVNTLLDFSRMEAGRVQAVYEPTDLAALTTDLAGVFRAAVEKAGLELTVDCPPLDEPVYVDREMWEKIVLNLVSNAFKFTFEGRIEVSLRAAAGHVALAVSDTGTGIPPEEQPELFERFHRVAGARGRTHEGSGIGLALVQELVKLHGGTIALDSAPGRGSTFTVAIPLGRAHLPAEKIGATRTLASTALGAAPFVEEALRWLPGEEAVVRDIDVPARGAESPEQAARIVFADDNADMREYVRRLLAPHYHVDTVADGEEALAAIACHKPDLVLSDIMMPRLDGMDLLARLRADPATKALPVILLSARAGEESRVEGMQAGADDYLIKPFSARELLARTEAHLKLARFRRQAEHDLLESQQRYRSIFDTAEVSIWEEDFSGAKALLDELRSKADGDLRGYLEARPEIVREALSLVRVLDVNETTLAMFDAHDKRELLGSLERIFAPGSETIFLEELLTLAEGKQVFSSEARLRSLSGRLLDVLFTIRFTPDGRALVSLMDVTTRKQAELALEESEARFRNMADHAPVMVWVTELDGSCSFLSQSWYAFTGQTPQTGLGLGWLDATHPDDRQAAQDTFLAANAKREAFRLEYRLRARDGEYRWAIDAAAPRFGENGEFLGYIGSVIDITDRKKAEETQSLLINELNHRVKNTLASVQAIVQHTLRKARSPAEFVESFSGRIQSLARAHSLLTATTWHGADLPDLIHDQLLQGAVDETRITASGPSVHLEAQMALHLALVLHELGTNAHKYGALSVPSGWVTIEWRVVNGSLMLKWQERGGPPPSAPTRRGFGTTLIQQSTKGAGGDASMSVAKEGILWQIAVPLPHAPDIRPPGDRSSGVPGDTVRRAHAIAHETFAGKRVLVIEDEPLVALDLTTILSDAGIDAAEAVGSARDALHVIETKQWDAALLDGNLHGQRVDEIAAALTRHKIPFMFITGYGREGLPQAFRTVRTLTKPYSPQQLLAATAGLLGKRTDVLRFEQSPVGRD